MDSARILWVISVVVPVLLSGFGSCIGQGLVGSGIQSGLARQRLGDTQEFGAGILGLAIAETGCILGLVMSILFFFDGAAATLSLAQAFAYIGSAGAIGIPACAVGLSVGSIARAGVLAISRQPFMGARLITMMLASAVFIEAPVILGFIVSVVLRTEALQPISLVHGVSLCISGLLFGASTLGPLVGQMYIARAALQGVGHAPHEYRPLLIYTLVCAAIIETPVILSLLLSLLIVYVRPEHTYVMLAAMTLGAAACSMVLGAGGAGVANGWVAARGCEQIARDSSLYAMVFRITMATVAIVESAAIYAFIVALLLYTRVV